MAYKSTEGAPVSTAKKNLMHVARMRARGIKVDNWGRLPGSDDYGRDPRKKKKKSLTSLSPGPANYGGWPKSTNRPGDTPVPRFRPRPRGGTYGGYKIVWNDSL